MGRIRIRFLQPLSFPPLPALKYPTPTSGAVGTSVTLTGTGFTGATSVKLNGTTATFTVASDTSITTTVPAGATSGQWTVTTPGGTGYGASFTVSTAAFAGDTLVAVNSASVSGTSVLMPGLAFEHYTLDSSGSDATALAAGKALITLTGAPVFMSQPQYGFGTTNPQTGGSGTAPDFAANGLDARIQLIQSMGGTPVINLDGWPDYMTYQPTLSYKEEPPMTTHDADLTAYVTALAKHYTYGSGAAASWITSASQNVLYYTVHNELKSIDYLGGTGISWDVAQYSWLYSRVSNAIRAVNASAKVGGPYYPLEYVSGGGLDSRATNFFTSFMTNKAGGTYTPWSLGHQVKDGGYAATAITYPAYTIDFLCHDGGEIKPPSTSTSVATLAAAPALYDGIYSALATIAANKGQSGIPIWSVEDYFDYNIQSDMAGYTQAQQGMLLTLNLIHKTRGGCGVVLRWKPQGESSLAYNGMQQTLFSDVRVAGGGQAQPFYAPWKWFHDHASPTAYGGAGVPFYTPTVTAGNTTTDDTLNVEAFATGSSTLIVNKTNASRVVGVSINGGTATTVTIPAYGIATL